MTIDCVKLTKLTITSGTRLRQPGPFCANNWPSDGITLSSCAFSTLEIQGLRSSLYRAGAAGQLLPTAPTTKGTGHGQPGATRVTQRPMDPEERGLASHSQSPMTQDHPCARCSPHMLSCTCAWEAARSKRLHAAVQQSPAAAPRTSTLPRRGATSCPHYDAPVRKHLHTCITPHNLCDEINALM